jgi:hypothetical protein
MELMPHQINTIIAWGQLRSKKSSVPCILKESQSPRELVSLLNGRQLWKIALTGYFFEGGPDMLTSLLSVATQRQVLCPWKEVNNSFCVLGWRTSWSFIVRRRKGTFLGLLVMLYVQHWFSWDPAIISLQSWHTVAAELCLWNMSDWQTPSQLCFVEPFRWHWPFVWPWSIEQALAGSTPSGLLFP